MTIARRLTLLLVVPAIVLAGLGVFVRMQIAKVESQTRFLVDTQVPSLAALGDIAHYTSEMRVHIRNYLLAESKDGQTQEEKLLRQNGADLKDLLARYGDSLISNDKDRRLFNDYRNLFRDWYAE